MGKRSSSSNSSKKKGSKSKSESAKPDRVKEVLAGANEHVEIDYGEESLFSVGIDLPIGSLGLEIGEEGIAGISAGFNLGVVGYETSDDFETCTRTLTVTVGGVVAYSEQEQIEGCVPQYSGPEDPPLTPEDPPLDEHFDGSAKPNNYIPPVNDPFDDPVFADCTIYLYYGGVANNWICREWYLDRTTTYKREQRGYPVYIQTFPITPTGAAPFEYVEGYALDNVRRFWGPTGGFRGYNVVYEEEETSFAFIYRLPKNSYPPGVAQTWLHWYGLLLPRVWGLPTSLGTAYEATYGGTWAYERIDCSDSGPLKSIGWSHVSPTGYRILSWEPIPEEKLPSLDDLKNPGTRPTDFGPPPPTPDMDKCCQAQTSMLRQIYEVLDPPSVKKTSLPKRLFYPDGSGQEAVDTYPEILKRMVLQTDKNGFHPFRLKVKDTNPAKTGDQSIDIEVKSLAGALQLLLQYAIDTEGDSDVILEILVRVAYELILQHKILAAVDAKTDNIEDFLDYEVQEIKTNLPLMFNPLAGVKNGKKSALDKNTEETTESLLPELLTQTEHPIVVSKNVSRKTLTHYLLQNLQASQLNGGRTL